MSSAAENDTSAPKRAKTRRRIAAILFGLALVVAAELGCRLAGWGDPNLREDPFVGFAGTRPLFMLTDDGSEYIIPHVREEYFARERFPARKETRTRRVFCLGGSTVQGRPYSIATSFTTWLELALNIADESQRWDVINCGGISYASYRLVPILEECLTYEPDLIILCTGHNEFLEDRSYPQVSRSAMLHRASEFRLVNLARQALEQAGVAKNTGRRHVLPLETEPILNFNGGLAVYHRDDAWREGVADHYAFNVRRLIAAARTAGVPVLLMKPCSNLRDCPPFKWEPEAAMAPAELSLWSELIEQARALRIEDPVAALQRLEQALRLDPENSLTHYELGRTHLQLRDYDAARSEFVLARDLDVCPLRMPSTLERRLEEIAAEEDLSLLDMQSLLEAQTTTGILGDTELVDHIHPSIEGHRTIARALVREMEKQGFVDLREGWETVAVSEFETHLETLDSAYFLRGQHMLEGLRAWAQGRADGPPADQRFPGRTQSPTAPTR